MPARGGHPVAIASTWTPASAGVTGGCFIPPLGASVPVPDTGPCSFLVP